MPDDGHPEKTTDAVRWPRETRASELRRRWTALTRYHRRTRKRFPFRPVRRLALPRRTLKSRPASANPLPQRRTTSTRRPLKRVTRNVPWRAHYLREPFASERQKTTSEVVSCTNPGN